MPSSLYSHPSAQLGAHFSQGIQAGAEATRVAEAVVSMVRGIDATLSPIVGTRGVSALFGRCVHLTARQHAWLLTGGHPAAGGVADLKATLASQGAQEAASAGLLFLQHFDALLTSLIGASLSERLLHPVWETFLNGPPIQDIAP